MAKPRVLVADDHGEMRSRIASLLGSEFDVVAMVGDGRAAVEATGLLQPELVVLDISMPVLSGLDAAARIGNLPRAPRIIFVSAFDAPEFVEAALSLGASGFVLKRNMALELLPVVRRALRGIRDSTTPIHMSESRLLHAVYFYEGAQSLSRLVAAFLGEGLTTNQPALVIATPAHKTAILAQLSAMAFDPQQRIRRGELFVLDADDVLSRFMVDRTPSAQRFEDTMVPIIDAMAGSGKRVVRAYGEMVDLLWHAQEEAAALSLENLWNTLASSRKLSLLCGYFKDAVDKTGGARQICDLHNHVVSKANPSASLALC